MMSEEGDDVASGATPDVGLDFSAMTVLEWNIQGLLDDSIRERMIAIIQIIKQNKPVAVMMQEVTLPVYRFMRKSLKAFYMVIGYEPLRAAVLPYFTAILVLREKFTLSSVRLTPFRMSQQGRDLLIVQGLYGTHDFAFLTSHIESTKSRFAERKSQMAQIYEVMASLPPTKNAVFGGDTNLRDAEFDSLVQRGKFDLNKVNDVWNMLGSPEDTRYSWDLQKNDNQIEDGTARLRFERLYVRCSGEGPLFKPTEMKFVGTERLPCGLFPSDHWGILTTFTL